ncbi:MarR family transcriptional regulator [Motilibacter rhizosphaerae]|uniref:MarR family transcriptional regulator n=1 Tax=Motilibacter rhizosphaerae TaxID=598652 RepID=A0A4Q7NR87_9ACTN|nr:MarR family transcriptional regulator [Motilibacter rhizosphaerae]RZS89567.1 MarR family transcriptional regulator [Motilibacter rhizosphaerae]
MSRGDGGLAAGDSPGFLLWRATLRWQRTMAATLQPLGLTHVQFVLLASSWWLGEHGGPPHQRALAAHASTDVMMTSSVVRALEARGLVRRTPDPQDSRAKRVTVTEEGAALARQAMQAVEAADAAFFAAAQQEFGTGELLALLRGLGDWEG